MLRLLARRHPSWVVTVGLALLSLVLVVWARTRPGFDPYGWLVWGHQTLAANLDTNAAPSWKPLPYLFTVPYALAGHYQLWLWMITSVAVSLSGAVFAGRIAYRLTDAPPERRYAGVIAAVFAGMALLGITNYSHYILSYQSDPMIVALCLGAIDCHLSGRPRWAFVLAMLASLGRPEVWLFAGLYTLWAWRAIPSMRALIVGGVLLAAALWFGIPALTSRTPFVAAANALDSGRRLQSNQVFGTISRFRDLHAVPLEIVALLSVALAVVRRDRVTLALAGAVVAWIVVEIAFVLHGWPGLGRYMFEAAGVMVVVAAVFIGRVLSEPLPLPTRAAVDDPGLDRSRARRPDRDQPRAHRDLPSADRAQGSAHPARADGPDQPAGEHDQRARRCGPVPALRRAADPARGPVAPGLDTAAECLGDRFQVRPGDRVGPSDRAVHAPV